MKLQLFHSLLRDDGIEFWQILYINPETTLKEVLTNYRKEYGQEDFKEVSQYKWDQLKYDPQGKIFNEFLKNLKHNGKQAFGP